MAARRSVPVAQQEDDQGLGSKRWFGTPSEDFVVGTLLEELKQFIDDTETYRSLEARLVTTTSLGPVEELFVLLLVPNNKNWSPEPAFGLWSSSC